MFVPELPTEPSRPPSKLSTHVYRYRVFATRYSTAMIWLWCGVMILGMGKLHYDINIKKKKLGCKYSISSCAHYLYHSLWSVFTTVSKDEIQPDPKMAATIRNTFGKLGLDKVNV